MAKTISIFLKKKNIGEIDSHYIDENENMIATLFYHPDRRMYTIFFYPEDLKHIIINDVSSAMKGTALIEKTLTDNGYEVKNKLFNLK